MQAELSPVIAATAQWLTRSYPACGGAFSAALCEAQARQAVTLAARLRYPTPLDAALVGVAGPGGSARLDRIFGADDAVAGAAAAGTDDGDEHAWRSWVDEALASWAACLLGDPDLTARAVAALPDAERRAAPAAGRAGGRAGPADSGVVPPARERVVASLTGGHAVPAGPPAQYRRLLAPDAADRRAAALLRHPDLLAPVADLHRARLLSRLATGSAPAA
ncbi:hypothetical protein [Streptomyces sp. JW3]|uniref:hypothetical protein n=1 Tax=Streptomyces sp. JW3 TaxID=3456955 RepID=UPI003FA4146A